MTSPWRNSIIQGHYVRWTLLQEQNNILYPSRRFRPQLWKVPRYTCRRGDFFCPNIIPKENCRFFSGLKAKDHRKLGERGGLPWNKLWTLKLITDARVVRNVTYDGRRSLCSQTCSFQIVKYLVIISPSSEPVSYQNKPRGHFTLI